MKNAVSKIFNIVYKFILIFTSICLFISLISATFFCVNRSYNYLNPLVLIIGSITYLLIIHKLYKYVTNLSEKNKKIICFILILFQFIMLMISTFTIKSVPKVDLMHITKAINSLNHTGGIINSEYFSVYPNNRLLLIILYYAQKISPNNSYIIFSIISSLSICVMSLFTYKAVKEFSDINKGLISLFILVFSPIFYLYVSYYYTDILMLPFSSILFYLIVKSNKNKSLKVDILYGILIGVTSIIGFKIRAVLIFLLISYFIYLMFNRKIIDILKKGLPIIFFSILTMFIINKVEDKFFLNTNKNKEFPVTHWIMMGFNKESNFYYIHDDYELSYSAKNKKDRINLNINEIKNRIKKINPITMIPSKLNTVWAKGDYSYQKYLDLVSDYNKSYSYLLEDKNIFINYLLQFSKIGILVLSIISLIRLYKENKKSVIAVALFLSVCFYLIWEVCPRYGLSFLPWLIIISSYSYDKCIFKLNSNKINNTFKYIIMSLTIILFILNFNKYTGISVKENIVSKSTSKKISYIELNKYNEITQSLKLNSEFNKIKLMLKVNNNYDNLPYVLELTNSKDNIVFMKEFLNKDISNNGYTIFDLDKKYNSGNYTIRLNTKSKNNLQVGLSSVEEYDFYPAGILKINDIEEESDIMFEIINKGNRRTYSYFEYILIMILSILIQYIVFSKNNDNKI